MRIVFVLLLTGAICSSCTHVYYAPNTANIPMLAAKGETRVNALYTSGGDSEFGGGEFQAACAVSSKIGVMLNFFAAGKSEDVASSSSGTSQIERGNGTYLEAAGGYFKSLDPKKKWIFEAYAGAGFGSVKNEYEAGDFSKVAITKAFLQPSLSYKSAYFEIGFAPKLSLINWKVKQEKIGTVNNDALSDVAAIKADPGFFAFEPAVLLRAGSKEVKLHLGLSFSGYNPTNVLYSTEITESVNGSLGISINIGPKKK